MLEGVFTPETGLLVSSEEELQAPGTKLFKDSLDSAKAVDERIWLEADIPPTCKGVSFD